ncbi:hypothetical protein CALVIDRAFT_568226 [Calocera viscosa TUFC12733]|uniref:Uncharacterized protein n=1 Tax=Calocera viscosa (strain TUFC12733) TaxID=1330018 RepID=A0A167HAK4_CALVF|nr:hypothetical protein CALVIDRAFT_568226 [Calocera viscosa TUFC12733]
MTQMTRLYETTDVQEFRGLGEGYPPENEKDRVMAIAKSLRLSEAGYVVPADEMPAENMVLMGGVENSIFKSTTIAMANEENKTICTSATHCRTSLIGHGRVTMRMTPKERGSVFQHNQRFYSPRAQHGGLGQTSREPMYQSGGQIVHAPALLLVVRPSLFLMATLHMMDPMYYLKVQAPAYCISEMYAVHVCQPGHVTQDILKARSPLYTVKALIPVIDVNEPEMDLQTVIQNRHSTSSCGRWNRRREQALGKDLMLKPRRQKELGDQIAVSKYLDDDFVLG